VIEATLDYRAELIMLDVAADLYGGNEIVRAEVRAFIRALNAMIEQTGGTIVFTGHVSQSGIKTEGGHSASTDWSNGVRTRWYLDRPKVEDGGVFDPDTRQFTRKKANFASIGDIVKLRRSPAGLFIPDGPSPTSAAASFRPPAGDVFLDLLDATIKEGQVVSSKSRASNFAPVLFSRRPPPARHDYLRADFERAMQQLFQDGRIKIVPYGPPSRGHEKLVRNNIEPAGVASTDDPDDPF
jgi:hypothetical protein